jgi:hypothetical protein
VGDQSLQEVTDACESCSDCTGVGSHKRRLLSEEYWGPAKALGQRVVQEVMPVVTGFRGQRLKKASPWYIRVDVGTQDGPLHDKGGTTQAAWATGEGESLEPHRRNFVNEIEITPTFYVMSKFQHTHDFIAVLASRWVATAFDVVGLDGAPPQFVDAQASHGAAAGADHFKYNISDNGHSHGDGDDSSSSSSSDEEDSDDEAGPNVPAQFLLDELSADTLAALRAHLPSISSG